MMYFYVSDATRISRDTRIRALIKNFISASDDHIIAVPLHHRNRPVSNQSNKIKMKKTIDLIWQDYDMGFITYKECVLQIAESLPYEERSAIEKAVQDIEDWHPEITALKRSLSARVDEIIDQNETITNIIRKYY